MNSNQFTNCDNTVGINLKMSNFRALSALNNAYLGNVMGTNVVTHRDSNSSIFLHERARVSLFLQYIQFFIIFMR